MLVVLVLEKKQPTGILYYYYLALSKGMISDSPSSK